MDSSIVQDFVVSDSHAQELIAGLLGGAEVGVTTETRGVNLVVATRCVDDFQAASVARLVRSIDPDARLLDAGGQGELP
jgi:hypothetical protein